jgi:glycosyltransferase involved in cell wall biosynthesis
MKILLLLDGSNGVAYHRLYVPFARIQQDHGIVVDVSQDRKEWASLDFTQYNCVVFNRWLGDLQYNILELLAKHKIPYIIDIDDYWIIPRHNPAYQAYRKVIKNCIKDAIYYADAVMTTTPQLASVISGLNKNITIVKNCLDYSHEQWNKTTEHPLTIGWVGGISHEEDIKLLEGQIAPICEKHNARFLMCGFHENSKIWAGMEKSITGQHRLHRPEWFEHREGTTPIKYAEYYSEIDILVAPLTEDKFNRYKSELKILEAAAYNRPILCSRVEPYTNHSSNLGVFFVDHNDWMTPLDKLIKSKKWDKVGEINRAYCDDHHSLKAENILRVELLKSVCR